MVSFLLFSLIRIELTFSRDGFKVNGVAFRTHIKEVSMKTQIETFLEKMEVIGDLQGWTVEEAQARFSNPLWDDVIFS